MCPFIRLMPMDKNHDGDDVLFSKGVEFFATFSQ
jgi:hypothetical protein